MKRQRMNSSSGFTLIETTVAMLVMMVVGLGATSLFLYSVRYNSGASQRSTAMAVAQQRLEVLRGVPYNAAGLAFGTGAPETVVIAPTTTTSTYTQGSSGGGGGGAGQSDAPVAFGNHSVDFSASSNPNATPTPGGGSGTLPSAPAGSTFYQIQTEVVAFPIGVSEAGATQKQITIRVVPVNGSGASAWLNQSPVEIVFHRSINVPGPYRQ
ncbi:MAG TPA: prepilin-type N-terminal cleavage/methylation domain-containing protein [Pyrinomonadaceae bacterium]|nr:prepilin-type N-terminal cleavage/methylation domain-containing protein [Pyrinomonadaceae bacterium]